MKTNWTELRLNWINENKCLTKQNKKLQQRHISLVDGNVDGGAE